MNKVKCINDNFSKVIEELTREAKGLPLSFPVKGETYTIRETFDNDGLVVSYLLEEIRNPTFTIPSLGGIRRELSFAEWRFEHIHEDITAEIEETQLLQTI
jgi:hypothetical protein